MSPEEKKQTGYDSLNSEEKQALNAWIQNYYFSNHSREENLSLSVNVHNGKELILSDGSHWEVHPEDRKTSSIWLTPFPLRIQMIANPSSEYPDLLINLSSEEKVKVKPISSSTPQENQVKQKPLINQTSSHPAFDSIP
jgi:hypothetical protein